MITDLGLVSSLSSAVYINLTWLLSNPDSTLYYTDSALPWINQELTMGPCGFGATHLLLTHHFSSTFYSENAREVISDHCFYTSQKWLKGRTEYFWTGNDQDEFQDQWTAPTPELNVIQPQVVDPSGSVWVPSEPSMFYWLSARSSIPYFLGHWMNG